MNVDYSTQPPQTLLVLRFYDYKEFGITPHDIEIYSIENAPHSVDV